MDGLSSEYITSLNYSTSTGKLLIGYQNGAIDVITGNSLLNSTGISRINLPGNKNINDIYQLQNFALISTDQGLANYDLQSNLVREIYSEIGSGGEKIIAYKVEVNRDSLWLLTKKGILKAPFQPNINLLDYRNWRLLQTGNINIIDFTFFQDSLFIAGEEGLFRFKGSWGLVKGSENKRLEILYQDDNYIYLEVNNRLFLYHNGLISKLNSKLISDPTDLEVDQEGILWLADLEKGLIRHRDLENEILILPDGPITNQVSKLEYLQNKLFLLPGGLDQQQNALNDSSGFSFFDGADWITYGNSGHPKSRSMPDFKDIADVAFFNNSYYFSSFGNGLLQWDGQSNFQQINLQTPGSPFSGSFLNPDELYFTSITASDKLFLTSYGSFEPLYEYDGITWKAYNLSNQYPTDLAIDKTIGNLWMPQSEAAAGGLLVFDPDGRQEKKMAPGSGNIPGNLTLDLTFDLEDQLWLATNNGPAYFPDARLVFRLDELRAIRPVFEFREFLRNERINCVAIDGGNRKWIGTDNGLWLFDESTETVFHQFTINNSPLPSSKIKALTINPETGEVFIGTSRGLVSFRSNATDGKKNHQQVKIFPNPVLQNYTGEVGISGLVENAIIKITDINGYLVYQSRSFGGTATWNLRNSSGEKVTSGIYLILSSNEERTETYVGKIAVID
jgi:hypothetical protein